MRTEGVGLSRTWFATTAKRGIEIRYGSAATELVLDGRGNVAGVTLKTVRRGDLRLQGSGAPIDQRIECGELLRGRRIRVQHG